MRVLAPDMQDAGGARPPAPGRSLKNAEEAGGNGDGQRGVKSDDPFDGAKMSFDSVKPAIDARRVGLGGDPFGNGIAHRAGNSPCVLFLDTGGFELLGSLKCVEGEAHGARLRRAARGASVAEGMGFEPTIRIVSA